jgi:hypothetical protein
MRIEDVQAYPLTWPEGWPRTPTGRRDPGNQFKVAVNVLPGEAYRARRPITFDKARRLLQDELGRLKAKNVVVSTNVALRNDGAPRAGEAERRLDDPGVAVYFTLKGKQMVMAQDAFVGIAANARSLGLAIEAIRALERHGGGTMMERAFAGFAALPAPEGSRPKRPWWIVLNYGDSDEARADVTVDEIEARYRALSKKRHPDAGGSTELFQELQDARDDAIKSLN